MTTAKEIVNELIEQTASQFIKMLEESKGQGKWIKPFFSTSGMHRNMFTKKMYEGFNIIRLEFIAQQKGFTSSLWATEKQILKNNRRIKYEEYTKSTAIVFWDWMPLKDENGKTIPKKDKDGNIILGKDGKPKVEEIPFEKFYKVYNESQLEGYVQKQPEKIDENILNKINLFKENYLDRIGASYTEGHGHACYIPSRDVIELPSISQFNRDMLLSYIPTACHETVHWSGAKPRLDRDLSGHFGSDSYAYEELIADIGAGFISQEFGQQYLFSQNNIKYIESWIKELTDKPRTLLGACSKAKEAYTYLMSLASHNED